MNTLMNAAVYYGPDDLRYEQRSVPKISPHEALVRVECASICGTDLRILHGAHRKFPPGTVRVPGHELVGTVAAIGSQVDLQVGGRVFVAPNMGCGKCAVCVSGRHNLCADYQALGVTLDGAFAEYVRIPSAALQQGNLMPIDPQLDGAQAALIEPLACVLRGQAALDIRPGDSVLIMGAGPIGILHLLLARLRGAGRVLVSEPHDLRRDQALAMGADRTINPITEDLRAVVLEETGGGGVGQVIVAAPSPQAQESAPALAAIGGRINFFGGLPKDTPLVHIDANLVHYKELVITGTTACSTADCRQAVEIFNSGRLDLAPLISARYPLERASEAFTAAEDRGSLKIVLELEHGPD